MINEDARLKRELHLWDAVWMGLGSILGTGIFVSIGLAAGISGAGVIIAVVLAAIVATFNALSAAQLAASHSVSGGTYEYGYHYLGPVWGFVAGWVFLLAKSASAATGALGFAGYGLVALGGSERLQVVLAFFLVVVLTIVVMLGARRTSRVNTVVVSVTIAALVAFVTGAFYAGMRETGEAVWMWRDSLFQGNGFRDSAGNLLEATALMFVAYTGYGRVATMAEEVAEPGKVIPRAIIVTLIVSAVLYVGVAVAGIATVGPDFLYRATLNNSAPLTLAAATFDVRYLPGFIAVGAATAMLGVLLNLILGLSRVTLAMGRRGDLPEAFAGLNKERITPTWSVLGVGGVIALLTLIGSVKTTWSFSALTVLIYYAITNAAALAVPAKARIFPRWISYAGLGSCVVLVLFIDAEVWVAGAGMVALGLGWFNVRRWWVRWST